MPKLLNRVVCGVKSETTQGAGATLAATDYMLVEPDTNIKEIAEIIKRNPRRSSIDELTHLVGKKQFEITITTELKGSGVAGTPYAPLGALLKACAAVEVSTTNGVASVAITSGGTLYPTSFPITFTGGGGSGALAFARCVGGIVTEIIILNPGTGYTTPPTAVLGYTTTGTAAVLGTVTTGSSVAYTPTSNIAAQFTSPGTSCQIEFYRDGLKHVLVGALGNCVETYVSGQIAYAKFVMKGKYAAVTDAAMPSTTYLAQVPVVLDAGNLRVLDYACVATKLEIDWKNTVAEREDINTAGNILGFMITDREPSGSIDPEMDYLTTGSTAHDFFALLNAASEGITCLKLGSVAGNIVWTVCPKTQYNPFGYADRSGILTAAIPLNFNQYLGDDWHALIFR